MSDRVEVAKRQVIAVVPRGQGVGFAITGVQVREVASAEDARLVLAEELENPSAGVILVDETFLTGLSRKLDRQVQESSVPLVVPIPIITQWEQAGDREHIVEQVIHHAIGYRIKLSG